MKRIYGFFTYSLLAVLLAITPTFSIMARVAQPEAENLEAWAKMYEDMNQASGGEIEKLMKDMEQSGELDALMKELEQSGELDMIVDAMLKSTPDDFMKQLEKEVQEEKQAARPAVHRPAPRSAPQPAVKKPAPAPVMQVDKTKLKQIKALLANIVSKIAAIKQKAASRRAVQEKLAPWEYHLTDLSYYLTIIQDDALAKYLQQPEFEQLYNNLVALNRSLSEQEPRLQIEQMLEVEFEDPYITLGFATSNISKPEVDTKYQQLVKEKNPFTIEDALKKEGLSKAEIEKRFKQAQQEYNKIFEAYKRIEQKETSARSFLSILQAFHKAIYQDKIIDDVKKLLGTYDPEALKLKEAQEQKEKEARDYKKKLTEQEPDFDIDFNWPSFGGSSRIGRRRPPVRGFGRPYRPSGSRRPTERASSADKAGEKEAKKNGKGKKGKGAKSEKKSGTKDKGTKKDDKKKKEEKPKGADLAKKAAPTLNQAKAVLKGAVPAIKDLFNQVPVEQIQLMITQATRGLKSATNFVGNQVKALKKAKDKDELKKYYTNIQKTFAPEKKDATGNYTELGIGKALEKVYQANLPELSEEKQELVKGLQNAYASLVYAVNDIGPNVMGEEITEVGSKVAAKSDLLKNVITAGSINPSAAVAIQQVGKELKDVASHLQRGIDVAKDTPIEQYYDKEIVNLVGYFLKMPEVSETLKLYQDIKFQPLRNPQTNIAASPAQIKSIKQLQDEYNKILDMI